MRFTPIRVGSFPVVACTLAASLLAAQHATAATSTYTTRAAFATAAGTPLTTETVEDETLGTKPSPTALAGSGLTTSVASGSVDIQIRNTDPSSYGTVNTTPGGTQFLAFGYANTGAGPFTAQFAGPTMTAFGFDLSGYQGTANGTGGFNVELRSGGSTVDSFFVADATAFSAHFRGFVATTPFDAIRLTFAPVPTNSDILAFDEISFGNAVPEPAALAAGVVGLALLRRRRA